MLLAGARTGIAIMETSLVLPTKTKHVHIPYSSKTTFRYILNRHACANVPGDIYEYKMSITTLTCGPQTGKIPEKYQK